MASLAKLSCRGGTRPSCFYLDFQTLPRSSRTSLPRTCMSFNTVPGRRSSRSRLDIAYEAIDKFQIFAFLYVPAFISDKF
jgi:hypothetical protein